MKMGKDEQIIRALHETDLYKILMMYFIWRYYPNLDVTFSFVNRNQNVRLSDHIDLNELREQFDAVSQMQFSDHIIEVLRSWEIFNNAFLNDLRNLKLESPEVWIGPSGLQIMSSGNWLKTTLWETYVLPIVSELYGRSMIEKNPVSLEEVEKAGREKLYEKIALIKRQCPNLKIIQFGLRRRFSGEWEDFVTNEMYKKNLLFGVSNLYIADILGIRARGTNAHELPMALTALARHISDEEVRRAPYEVLRKWQRLYGNQALIILDDTYGSDCFRRNLPPELLGDFRGFRQDSGDPIAYAENTIEYYRRNNIDPKEKLLLFSDGLTAEKAVALYKMFEGQINTSFGIGTNLTHDVGFVKPLPLVMKLVEAAGNSAVKLSNNLSKAIGDPEEIEEIKRIFGYTNTSKQEIVY
jgi:nicotinate phosphoribosyltransferase